MFLQWYCLRVMINLLLFYVSGSEVEDSTLLLLGIPSEWKISDGGNNDSGVGICIKV